MTVVKNPEAGASSSAPPPPPRRPSNLNLDRTDSAEVPDALVSDGFSLPSLEAENEAPPAYGDLPDQLQFNQAGFEAGANVTGNVEFLPPTPTSQDSLTSSTRGWPSQHQYQPEWQPPGRDPCSDATKPASRRQATPGTLASRLHSPEPRRPAGPDPSPAAQRRYTDCRLTRRRPALCRPRQGAERYLRSPRANSHARDVSKVC